MNRLNLQRGFTLAELAVVLVIVGLLLGGMMVPLSAQYDSRYINDTQKTLNDIRDALLGFAAANGRLPCPARATAVPGDADAGLEPSPIIAGGCAHAAGVLPWATLGVPETDAWGNRFTYRVTPDFARVANGQNTYSSTAGTCTTNNNPPTNPPINPQFAAFALCSQGDMTILNTVGGNNISINIPAVVISHGKNGNGAFTTQGTRLPIGGDADELDNQLNNAAGTATANTNFVSKTPTPTFDDSVIWVSSNVLFNRMIAAGKLP